MSSLQGIYDKCLDGQRLSVQEGLELYRQAPLLELGDLAHRLRMKRLPKPQVSFVMDTNLNYTNVCDAYCTFCAFYRTEKDEDKYTYTVPQMVEKIKASQKKFGATTFLIQG